MVFFNVVLNDFKNGILKNYRYLSVIIIAFLNFSVARIMLVKNGQFDILLIDILDKALSIYYFPMTILFFAIFICLDYTHKSFTLNGVQSLYRANNRVMFYLAKCVFCILSALHTWVVYLLTSVLFCTFYGYGFEIPQNIASGFLSLERNDLVVFILSPIAVLITLNILQMTVSLLIKPMLAYFAIALFTIIGAASDSIWLFARSGVSFYYDIINKDEYDTGNSLKVCILSAFIFTLIGTLCFKKYDILPDKGDN